MSQVDAVQNQNVENGSITTHYPQCVPGDQRHQLRLLRGSLRLELTHELFRLLAESSAEFPENVEVECRSQELSSVMPFFTWRQPNEQFIKIFITQLVNVTKLFILARF